MNKSLFLKSCFLLLVLVLSPTLPASADDHNYQVTGPVLSVTDSSIVVQKGKSPWEVSRDANTKVTGDLKVGSKVTIKYHMVADTVVSK